jgi:hypothetical protein
MGRQNRVVERERDIKRYQGYEIPPRRSVCVDGYNDDSSSCFGEENECAISLGRAISAEMGGGLYAEKSERREKKQAKRTTSRKIVNKPASQPYIRMINGEKMLCFKYPTKATDDGDAVARRDGGFEEIEFSIRFDVENVDVDKIPEKFRMENSVYPRANMEFSQYTGNRWEYETEVNRLAWQLTALNPALLYGKKGIVQRAVDSYRNLNRSTSSRRVIRMKKLSDGTLRKRQADGPSTTASVVWTQKGVTRKCRVRIDLESVDYEKIDNEFKNKYSVFSGEFDDRSFGLGRWENHSEDNVIAVKIAFLNIDNSSFWNAIKATDKALILKKAVDAYKNRFRGYEEERYAGRRENIRYEESSMSIQEDLYFIDQSTMQYCDKPMYYHL